MGQVVIKSLQLLHHRHQRPHQHNFYLDLEVTLKVTLCQVCQMVWQCISMENEDNRAFQLENKPFPKSSTLHIQRWLHLIRFNWSGQSSKVMSSNLLNLWGSNLTSLMSLWSLAMASRGLRSCNTRRKLLGKNFKWGTMLRSTIGISSTCAPSVRRSLERGMVFNFTFTQFTRIETTPLLPLVWRRKCSQPKSNDLLDLSSLESIT